MTAGLPLVKSVLKSSLAKNALIQLGLSGENLAADEAVQKKIYGSGTTALIITKEEMEDMMEVVKSLQEARLLLKGISKTIKNEAKEEKGRLLSMFSSLAASILGNTLAGKREAVIRAGEKF